MKKPIRLIFMIGKFYLYGFFLQILFINLLHANPSNAQSSLDIKEVILNLSLEDVPLSEIFSSIQEQTDFSFFYESTIITKTGSVSIDADHKSMEEVLLFLAREYRLSFKQVNERISVKEAAQVKDTRSIVIEQTVTGTVTDQNGKPLPGVTVSIPGTAIGTATDLDGRYSLSVPEGSTLVFSFIGFESQSIAVGDRSVIDVVLSEDMASLDEVVVVGYGVQQKVNLTGAISTVDFGNELTNRPLTNASQALGGTASGVWVSQNSGKPGSDGAQIRVRGWGTLNNSNPLIIVDGVEGSFDQINPNDIETISVLKDAASAAIYGSKAANGVVLITTKMGKQNEKMQVNVNSYVGIQSLGRKYDLINNSAEHMELTNIALINEGSASLFSEELIANFKNSNDPYKFPNTDWYEVLFRDASIQEHNVSIRGGSAQTSTFLSFNYLDQEGIVPNTHSKRYGLRANIESNVKNWLKVSGRVNYIRRQSNEPYADATYGSLGRVFEMLGGATPYIAPYTRDGRFGSVQAIDEDGNLLYDNRNPLIDAANGKTTTSENILTLNANAEVKINESLSWRTTFASTGSWELVDKYNVSVFGYTDTGVETITKNFNREGLEISRSQVSTLHNNLFSTLNYQKTLSGGHDIAAIAGLQMESSKIQNVFARRTSPPQEGLTQVDAGTSGIQGEGNMNGIRMFSYFGRVNYAFNGKYLFEANIRADASSRFRQDNRWGVFPGISAGWRVSDEGFLNNSNFLSNLKLRASWGQLGNQNISGYWPYLTVINQSNDLSYNYNGNFAPGAAVTSLVDQDITWETTSTLDFGFDMGLLDDRITIEADYFKKKTENIIVQLPIPLILGGIAAPFENVGEMTNEGFEFMVNYDNLKLERNQFNFNVGLNLTYIKNEVTKFRGGDAPDQLYLIREGYAYRTLYGYKSVGIYQTDAEAKEHMHSNGLVPKAGNLKFEDVNNDGRLGFEDKQAIGNTIPKYTFGLSGNFKYKGFDLNLLFQGIAGVDLFTHNLFTNVHWENRVLSTKWRDAWTPENTDTDVPRIRFNDPWDNLQSSYWVQQVNFVKLKNVQLGYAFPEHLYSHWGLQKLYVYANAQNVFTLVSKDYEGYDPERNTFDSGNRVYPIPRIISLGINLNF